MYKKRNIKKYITVAKKHPTDLVEKMRNTGTGFSKEELAGVVRKKGEKNGG